jgi:hypothetical protein
MIKLLGVNNLSVKSRAYLVPISTLKTQKTNRVFIAKTYKRI